MNPASPVSIMMRHVCASGIGKVGIARRYKFTAFTASVPRKQHSQEDIQELRCVLQLHNVTGSGDGFRYYGVSAKRASMGSGEKGQASTILPTYSCHNDCVVRLESLIRLACIQYSAPKPCLSSSYP